MIDRSTPGPATPTRPDCRCGHPLASHDHYRPGLDCGQCGPEVCDNYRPVSALLTLWHRLVPRSPRQENPS